MLQVRLSPSEESQALPEWDSSSSSRSEQQQQHWAARSTLVTGSACTSAGSAFLVPMPSLCLLQMHVLKSLKQISLEPFLFPGSGVA
jgi:hypothetical protein